MSFFNSLADPEHFRSTYGPWAVVTGASDGLGRQFALDLASAGMSVVLVARRRAKLDEVADQIRTAGGEAHVLPLDLQRRESWERLFDETSELDIGLLVASAGFGDSGAFVESDLETQIAMVDVNCTSLMVLTHRYSRRFVEQGRGGVVLLSSVVAFQGVPNAAHYAATKAYVQSLAEGLHHELEGTGVQVIASAPGPVDSAFAQRANMRLGKALSPSEVTAETLRALTRRRMTVRPGWLSKVLAGALATAPRFLRVRIMQGVMGGMTAHQRPALASAHVAEAHDKPGG